MFVVKTGISRGNSDSVDISSMLSHHTFAPKLVFVSYISSFDSGKETDNREVK